MEKDGLTVVVPTFNSRNLLAKTLDSMCNQTLEKKLFEVIVVDDGSTDGTNVLVSEYKNKMDIHYLFQEDRGFRVAAARNMGIRRARFKATLFIDAGIVISPRLLAIHYRKHQNTSNLVLIGISYGVLDYSVSCADLINTLAKEDIDEALKQLSCVEETFDCRAPYLMEIDFDLSNMNAPWLIFWGGHVSVPTSLIKRLRGFDEWFNHWGGEDNELGIRLYQAGCSFQILRDVESIHLPHPKNAEQKRSDARINVKYIHQKHELTETALLIDHNWKCIVSGNYEKTKGTFCRCMEI